MWRDEQPLHRYFGQILLCNFYCLNETILLMLMSESIVHTDKTPQIGSHLITHRQMIQYFHSPTAMLTIDLSSPYYRSTRPYQAIETQMVPIDSWSSLAQHFHPAEFPGHTSYCHHSYNHRHEWKISPALIHLVSHLDDGQRQDHFDYVW